MENLEINKTLAERIKKQQLIELRGKWKRNENDHISVALNSNEQILLSPLMQVDPEPVTPLLSHIYLHIDNESITPLQIMSPTTQDIYNEVIADPKLQFSNITDCCDDNFVYVKDTNIEQNFELITDETTEDGCEETETTSTSELHTRKKRSRLERNCSKVLRNTGQSYVNALGKVVPARKRKELSLCRLQCAKRFTTEEQMHCFENYWKLGDREKRADFVSTSIKILPKKSQIMSRRVINREFYCKYKLEIFDVEKPICKECFCRILGETKGFVNVIMGKKKVSPNGIIEKDKRGRKPPTNKRTDEELASVKTDILSFPSYENHYSRKCTGKKYLGADLSVAKMYRDDINLSFKKPPIDKCNTCDVLNTKIKVATEDCKLYVFSELAEHQYQAEKEYAKKRLDKERVQADPSVRVFEFHLQQCLPTPYQNTSVSVYKHHCLTIHDLGTNETTCFVCNDTIGPRGANQIASCLWHFCNSLPSEVKELIFYSDKCDEKYDYNIVARMFMFLLNNRTTLQGIFHKFLVSGHTHMECNSDHAIIEKTKERTEAGINNLDEWVQLVRSSKVKKPFKYVVMTLKDFFDFSKLKSTFTVKKTDNNTINISVATNKMA